MSLLISALVMFIAFHFLTSFGDTEKGWTWWRELFHILRWPRNFRTDAGDRVAIACFLNFSLLITSSPFLSEVWIKSRIAWGLATIFSGMAASGFWIMYLSSGTDTRPGLGGWCLLLAPILNFAGLLLARGNRQKNQACSDRINHGQSNES